MIYKSKRILLAAITIFLCYSGVSAQSTNFDKLITKFEDGSVFKAAFEHEFTDSYTGEVMHSSGDIWINDVGYKLVSEDQVLVVDGEFSRVYDRNRNRVVIDDYIPEDDDFAPSRMLKGVDSTYTVTEEVIEDGTKVTLETDDDFAVLVLVEIYLDDLQNPVEIIAYDISENVIVTTFNNGTFEAADEDTFILSYPDDAEIIDLRN